MGVGIEKPCSQVLAEIIFLGLPILPIGWWNILAIKALIKEGIWASSMVEGIIYRMPMHSMTIVMSTILYIVLLFHFYKGLDPLIRVGSSILLVVFGLTFYEAFWHIGCYKVWVLSGLSKTGGIPVIWSLYASMLFVCIVYLNLKYKNLYLNIERVIVSLVLLALFIGSWFMVLQSGFYQNFLLFERGLGPDPHDWLVFVNVVLGRAFWLPLVKKI